MIEEIDLIYGLYFSIGIGLILGIITIVLFWGKN